MVTQNYLYIKSEFCARVRYRVGLNTAQVGIIFKHKNQ